MNKYFARPVLAIALGLIFSCPAMAAEDYTAKAQTLIDTKLKAIAADPAIIAAVKAQNEKNAALTQADVDALDKKWKEGDTTLINGVLGNDLSKKLKETVASSGGLYTEMFVTDNKGLNVGQNDKTSDYWQGDEDKWKKPSTGQNDVSEVEMDESTQTYQIGVSVPIKDGETFIGALTVGANAEMLQ